MARRYFRERILPFDQLNKEIKDARDQQMKFFNLISHELRNPLFWFRNLIQLLMNRIDNLDKDVIKKSLYSLNESAGNTFHLMDNLLHWSRTQLGNINFNPEPINIAEIIKENIKLLQQFADYKNISLLFKDDHVIFAIADKEMIKTVIRNLLSNALKYTQENGSICVKLNVTEDKVVVSVKDDGIGMSPVILDKILNAKEKVVVSGLSKEAGSGLGLTLCKEFVEKHNSSLVVNSLQGEGSEFLFELPLAG